MDTHTSEFTDVNDNGEIVGRGNAPSGQMRALYKAAYSAKDQGYYDLGVLGAGIANAGTESVAKAISANGIIVGQSRLKVGTSQVWRAFVASNARRAAAGELQRQGREQGGTARLPAHGFSDSHTRIAPAWRFSGSSSSTRS